MILNLGIFVGYSMHSKAYKIFNEKTSTIEEYLHVSFDESNSNSNINDNNHDDDDFVNQPPPIIVDDNPNDTNVLPKAYVGVRNHPRDLNMGDISRGVQTR